LEVVAVDINPHALAAVRDNAVRNGVTDRIEVRHRAWANQLVAAFTWLAALSIPTGWPLTRPDEQ
jgi:methylase of polypeptide subunit release factors